MVLYSAPDGPRPLQSLFFDGSLGSPTEWSQRKSAGLPRARVPYNANPDLGGRPAVGTGLAGGLNFGGLARSWRHRRVLSRE